MTIGTPALPQEFLSRLASLLHPKQYDAVVTALSSDRPTTFRVNRLKTTPEVLLPALETQGFAVSLVPWSSDAFILTQGTLRALSETPQYRNGELYVQSLSSMLPPLILNPQPGERVLDIAAAPGSKTTQMATLMHNRGEIVANDTSQTRIYRLKANMALQGATIAHVSRDDGRSIWKRYPEYFDKVLVDIPCSMEGRFNAQDPKTYQDWSVKKVKDLSHLQRWMLRSAVSATKPGGSIVYSTCTMSPEENEDVIDWILEKEKGNVIMEDVLLAGASFDPAVIVWGAKQFDTSIEKSVRIYPTNLMEGFYIAKLKKIRSSVPKTF
ncbi:MAG: RsmB/NOP family class I SAM-dependent RNA methyltransferase [Patescibacteria group bacterium]